jgi:hypothetical protein
MEPRVFREIRRQDWPRLLTVDDIVAITGWHPLTVQTWLREGILVGGVRTEEGSRSAWALWREDLFRQIDPRVSQEGS